MKYVAQDRNGWIVVQDRESGAIVEDGYETLEQAQVAAKRFNDNN